MKIHGHIAVLSLVLAIFTWFLVTGREKVDTWIPVAVEMTNVPEGLIIRKGMINRIEARVRGPKGLIQTLDKKKPAYPLNVNDLHVGENLIELNKESIPLSSAFEVVELKPGRLLLSVDRVSSKTVPVVFSWDGEIDLHRDYQLLESTITPRYVELQGPESVLKNTAQAAVQSSVVFDDDVPELWREELPVVVPDELEANPGLVRVELLFGPKTQVIPIKARNILIEAPDDYEVIVDREFVNLEIEGPVALFRNDKFRKDIAVVVKIGEDPELGVHEVEYWVTLPDRCRLITKSPDLITAEIKKK